MVSPEGRNFPIGDKRYKDAATEFDVFRLTDPAHESRLPACYGRALPTNGSFLIYSSDRSGTAQAYRMDLKSGQSRSLTEASGLVPIRSPWRTSGTFITWRAVPCFYQSRQLCAGAKSIGLRTGSSLGHGFSVSEDGLYAALVEQKPGSSRLRLVAMRTGTATTLAETPIRFPIPCRGPSARACCTGAGRTSCGW